MLNRDPWHEKFDALTPEQLRAAGSLKWSEPQEPAGAIGMWLAEMDYGLAPAVADVLHAAALSSGIGYACGRLCEDASAAAFEWYCENAASSGCLGGRAGDGGLGAGAGLSDAPGAGTAAVTPAIYTVPNVLGVLELMLKKLIPAGAPVIVPTPAYMPMLTIPPRFGHPVIEVPSPVGADGRYELDLEAIERALREQHAKLLILVNPWNPVGRVLSRAELEALDAVMAQAPDARVFVDEIHCPLVLEGEFVPYATVSRNAARQAVTAFAPTKGWNIPGLKVAYALLSQPSDAQTLEPEWSSFSELVPTVGLQAAVAACRDSRDWLASVKEYLRGNCEYFAQRVAKLPGVKAAPIEGTYIEWLDFSGAVGAGMIPAGVAPANWVLEHAGVALTDGAACGAGYENYARIILACPRPVLAQALDRIEQALRGE